MCIPESNRNNQGIPNSLSPAPSVQDSSPATAYSPHICKRGGKLRVIRIISLTSNYRTTFCNLSLSQIAGLLQGLFLLISFRSLCCFSAGLPCAFLKPDSNPCYIQNIDKMPFVMSNSTYIKSHWSCVRQMSSRIVFRRLLKFGSKRTSSSSTSTCRCLRSTT